MLLYGVLLLLKRITPLVVTFITDYELSLARIVILWLPVVILLSPVNKPTGGIFGDVPITLGESNLVLYSLWLHSFLLDYSPKRARVSSTIFSTDAFGCLT